MGFTFIFLHLLIIPIYIYFCKYVLMQHRKNPATREVDEAKIEIDTRQVMEYSEDIINVGMSKPQDVGGIDTLVIGGGGTAGYCYMGAISELFSKDGEEHKPKLSNIKNYIGTSAGAIVSAIIASTNDPAYLTEKFLTFDLTRLQDNSCGVIVDLYRLWTKFGYNKGRYALSTMRSIMKELTGHGKITFAQHYEITGKNLVITGVNMELGQIVYFNRLTHPNMEIALAVRISMSIPIMFVPVNYAPEKFQDIFGDSEQPFVDGGLIDNYPMRFLFTSMYSLLNSIEEVTDEKISNALDEMYDIQEMDVPDHITEQRKIILNKTIGLKIYSPESLSTMSIKEYGLKPSKSRNVKDFSILMLNVILSKDSRTYVSRSIWNRTVKINVGNKSTFDFGIDENGIAQFITAGKTAAADFIQG